MNVLFSTMSSWPEPALRFGWSMLWQSSLVIAVLLVLDRFLRNRLRPHFRYLVWLLVLVKLVLPPSLALPTAPGWWLARSSQPAGPSVPALVTESNREWTAPAPASSVALPPAPSVWITPAGLILGCAAAGTLLLLAGLVLRWVQVTRMIRRAQPAPAWVDALAREASQQLGLRRAVCVQILDRPTSPAVCGLLNPAILLPSNLVDQLSPLQMRGVLLHELIHLRRGDLWVNCLQALFQVLYWWHPLLWVANARIRAAREEAVDEAVLVALRGDCDVYAPTLLEVARLSPGRPLATLGLVGILESHRALKRRIERAAGFAALPRAGSRLAFGALALALGLFVLPMGAGPAARTSAAPSGEANPILGDVIPRVQPSAKDLEARIFRYDPPLMMQRLEALRPGPVGIGTNPGTGAVDLLRQLFASKGVDFTPPKSIYLSLTKGTLLVRATAADLATIDQVIEALGVRPAQVLIKARFVSVPPELARGLFSGLPPGASNAAGLFTPDQFRTLLEAVRAEPRAEVLSEPQVVTLSGRQAQIQVGAQMAVATNLLPQALVPPGVSAESDSETNLFAHQTVLIGPILDLLPKVDAAGKIIHLTCLASVTEFLGYASSPGKVTAYLNGKPRQVSIPMPEFRQHGATNAVEVPDGHTLVLGTTVSPKAKSGDRQLLVLVTPTVVDPTGQPVHPPEAGDPRR